MAGMQLQQSMATAQHRSAMGLQVRSNMPMGNRPTPGHMVNSGSFRPQGNMQQQAAAYTRAARNLPQAVS